jgi:hypothetical protein
MQRSEPDLFGTRAATLAAEVCAPSHVFAAPSPANSGNMHTLPAITPGRNCSRLLALCARWRSPITTPVADLTAPADGPPSCRGRAVCRYWPHRPLADQRTRKRGDRTQQHHVQASADRNVAAFRRLDAFGDVEQIDQAKKQGKGPKHAHPEPPQGPGRARSSNASTTMTTPQKINDLAVGIGAVPGAVTSTTLDALARQPAPS